MLADGDAPELLGGPDGGLVLVDGDELPDDIAGDPAGEHRLATLPAVIAALVEDPTRRPAWADVVLAHADPLIHELTTSVHWNPLAATTLVVLLRTSERLGLGGALAAESAAYGLLQGSPEFPRWRSARHRVERPAVAGPTVEMSRDDDVLHLTLNRPHVHNAFNATMRDELLEGLDVATRDPSVTAIELTGAGPSFCSGGDLDEFGTRPDPATAHLMRLTRNAGRSIAALSDRITVRVHGATLGSGIELAAFAGRVIAAGDTRIALPEIGLGLIPGAGGTVSLPARIGRHRTARLALCRERIDATTALEWGLVDEIA